MSNISQITKLKKFGIFYDFMWNSELPSFKKYNLIYGWNRSGKTTLSRIFTSCEKKCVYDINKFKQYPENGEFELKTNGSTTVRNSDVDTNILPIKVFNQDFIDDNISFDPSDSCNAIVYVSEEDIESKNRLALLKQDQIAFSQTYELAKKDKASKEETKSIFLTGLGREISNMLFDKTYNKTKVESKINSIGIDNFVEKSLSEEDKKKYETIGKSEAGKEQLAISKLRLVNFDVLFMQVKSLLDKKVLSELLQRLKDPDDFDGGLDVELNNWVKQGFDIHKAKNQFNKCLFCENDIDNKLFDSLSKHFSKDYEALQSSIEYLVNELKNETLASIAEKDIELYSDLRNAYEETAKKYNEIVKRQNDWLWNSELWLEKKYKNPFDPDIPEMVKAPEGYTELLNKIIDELNEIISTHNIRVRNHKTEVINAREKLELYSIAVALSEQDYKKMCDDLGEALKKEKEALDILNQNNHAIQELEKQTSNIGMAIMAINKHLNEFFGRTEIELSLDGDNKGYKILRDGKPAINLSEGEKTAIAFSYFVVKVDEGDFNKAKGIIFIDDPISSFDSNFIFHCFSLIKNHFNQVGQLFVSTHNFQLFNLVKDWFIRKNNNVEEGNKERKLKGNPEKELTCEFYMIKPILGETTRRSKIAKLDSTLKDYKSEYSFLFSVLNNFMNKTEEPSFEEIYNVANIGRRFLDIFADFKIPTNKREQKEKIDIIVSEINKSKSKEEDKISSIECDKIFWLLNWHSHNSDPTSAIEHKDKIESKDAIRILLNIVKESDPIHYEVLLKA